MNLKMPSGYNLLGIQESKRKQPEMTSTWDERIERATKLSSVYPFAAEALRFLAQVAMLQQKLYVEFKLDPNRFFDMDGSLFGQVHPPALQGRFSTFLASIRQIAPPGLAEAADCLAEKDSASWLRLIEESWLSPTADGDNQDTKQETMSERCLAWLFLQPCAEYLAARHEEVLANGSPTRCPLCGAKPIVGVLRPQGDGAKKSLICMLCAYEWAFRRVYCPACGEDKDTQMAFYSAPEIPHVRIDVCDSCHTYLKTVDLTKTGIAVPVVDEVAALPLDLWARDNGYHKLQMNIVGI